MKTFAETLVSDFLSDVTRRERRSLLGLSALAIAVIYANLIPTKISAFGIDFTESSQAALLNVFVMILLYYVMAFLIYGLSDFSLWRHQYFDALDQETSRVHRESLAAVTADPVDPMEEHMLSRTENLFLRKRREESYSGHRRWGRLLPLVSLLRAVFDFAFPLIFAGVAITCLLNHR